MKNKITLNNNEQGTIAALKFLAKNWPPDYWLFAADGKLYVMKYNEDGEHVIIDHTGGMGPQYIVDVIDIDTDGGDW